MSITTNFGLIMIEIEVENGNMTSVEGGLFGHLMLPVPAPVVILQAECAEESDQTYHKPPFVTVVILYCRAEGTAIPKTRGQDRFAQLLHSGM